MRTRIALVAIVPVALITSVPVPRLPWRASPSSSEFIRHGRRAQCSHGAGRFGDPPQDRGPPSRGGRGDPAVQFRATGRHIVTTTGKTTPNTIALAALARASAPPTPEVVVPVDTVTPGQRAAWEQVALCEEGGDWSSDGSSFSGGLGISRANWDATAGLNSLPRGPTPLRTNRSWWPSASSPVRPIRADAVVGSRSCGFRSGTGLPHRRAAPCGRRNCDDVSERDSPTTPQVGASPEISPRRRHRMAADILGLSTRRLRSVDRHGRRVGTRRD